MPMAAAKTRPTNGCRIEPRQSITHHEIKSNVMAFERKRFDDLKTKSNPDLDRARGAMSQKAIEKTRAASDSRPCPGESDPGNKDKVDRREDRDIMLAACGRQNRNDFAASPAQICDQWRDLRFVTKRFEDDNHLSPFPNR